MKTSAEKSCSDWLDKIVRNSVLIFCLFVFPLFIIYSSLTRLYELKIENLRQEKTHELAQALEILDSCSSNRKYFHQLFKLIFDQTQKNPDPPSFLNANKKNLQKNYPGCFEFIVWNDKGQMIEELTDQKGFKFILSRLFEALKELETELNQDLNLKIADLPAFAKSRNLISKFLGRFFIPEHMKLPYLHGKEAGPAKVDFSLHRSDYWYHVGNKISFLVFFNKQILSGFDGLEKVVKSMNRISNQQLIGFIKGNDIDRATIRPDLDSDLKLALARFENFDRPVIETEKALFSIRNTGDDLRIFAVRPKEKKLWSVSERRNLSLARIVFLFFISYLLVYFAVWVMQMFVSIRLKLTLVFLFANIIPLIVLSFIGYEYISSKAVSIRNEFIDNSFEILRNFDLGSETFLENSRLKMVAACDQVNKHLAGKDFSDENFSELKKTIAEVNPSEAYLVSSEARKIFDFFPENYQPSHSSSYVIPMIAASLKFLNGIPIEADSGDYFNALLSPAHSEFIRHARRNSCKIAELNTGNSIKTAFQYAFGIPGKTPYDFYLIMLWDKKNLNRQYLNRYFFLLQKQLRNSMVFVRSANGTEFWPDRATVPESVQKFLEQSEASTQSISQRIFVNQQPHLAVGMKGRLLTSMVIASIVPEELLNQQVNKIKLYIFLAIILNLILTVAISLLLSSQLVKPLYELQKATVAIGEHNFRYRVPALDHDEIGYLGTIFNRVIEGLGDLEVARIVQESLFPGNRFSAGPYQIYGKSMVMTTLGGDYYDCFEIDSQRWALIIGDVAGHGVPAGLMMAMAKSGVLTSSKEKLLNPTALTTDLHYMFFAVKNPNMKRMMTFQYFVLDHQNDTLTFANAGHCFPLLIDSKTMTAVFIEHVATPLGIGPKARYRNFEFALQPGQALILYTDGLAEAKNSNGEEFGYERMQQLFPALYHQDPEVYYQRILEVYQNWAAKSEDDLTIIVCLRENHNE